MRGGNLKYGIRVNNNARSGKPSIEGVAGFNRRREAKRSGTVIAAVTDRGVFDTGRIVDSAAGRVEGYCVVIRCPLGIKCRIKSLHLIWPCDDLSKLHILCPTVESISGSGWRRGTCHAFTNLGGYGAYAIYSAEGNGKGVSVVIEPQCQVTVAGDDSRDKVARMTRIGCEARNRLPLRPTDIPRGARLNGCLPKAV